MTTPTDRMVRVYTAAMIGAVKRYEEQKRRFEQVKAAYAKPGRDPVTANLRANSDPRLADAASLAGWYRDEAAMYAAVITALRADEPVTLDRLAGYEPERVDAIPGRPLPAGVEGHDPHQWTGR